MVEAEEREGQPYALIFMDVRMTSDLNGIEVIRRIWRKRPFIEMIICTAFSDYTWNEIIRIQGQTDHLLFMRKPFDSIAVKQAALSITRKWDLERKNREYVIRLEEVVIKRTANLQKTSAGTSDLKHNPLITRQDSVTKDIQRKDRIIQTGHEIRTYIKGISGLVNRLRHTELKSEQEKLMDQLYKSIDIVRLGAEDIAHLSKRLSGGSHRFPSTGRSE